LLREGPEVEVKYLTHPVYRILAIRIVSQKKKEHRNRERYRKVIDNCKSNGNNKVGGSGKASHTAPPWPLDPPVEPSKSPLSPMPTSAPSATNSCPPDLYIDLTRKL
jgi:hypothetical protein